MRNIFKIVGYVVLAPLFVFAWPLYLLWYLLFKKEHTPDYTDIELLGIFVVILIAFTANWFLKYLYFVIAH